MCAHRVVGWAGQMAGESNLGHGNMGTWEHWNIGTLSRMKKTGVCNMEDRLSRQEGKGFVIVVRN